MTALRAGRIAEVWTKIQSEDYEAARNLVINSPHIDWKFELGPTTYADVMEAPYATPDPAHSAFGQPLAAKVVYRRRPRR